MATHSNIKVLLVAVLMIFLGGICAEKVMSGTYTSTIHGSSTSGVDRSAIGAVGEPYASDYVKGHCGHCHEQHASVGGSEPTPPTAEGAKPYALFKNNYGSQERNELCYACHEIFILDGMTQGYGREGIYQGKTKYEASVHDQSGTMIWADSSPPGPSYDDSGNCHNCHNPHGYNDGTGVINHMLFQRDGQSTNEMGCEACHDGTQASKDIKTEFSTKSYTHPTHTQNTRHAADESGSSAFGVANRHAECVDCHNPHTIGAINPNSPTVHPAADYAPNRTSDSNKIGDTTFGSAVLQGVWGVEPSYSGLSAWQRPNPGNYTELKPPNNPDGAEKEYQICFKCHSSYGEPGLGDPYSIAREFSPQNLSGHPVVGVQNNRTGSVAPKALDSVVLRAPWSTNTGNLTMYCSDCHGNDSDGGNYPIGVHGSDRPNMLRSWIDIENPNSQRRYWPYRPSGGYWSLKDISLNRESWLYRLFCTNCHKLYVAPDWSNNVHSNYYHSDAGDLACVDCHVVRVHGSEMGRLIGGLVTVFNKQSRTGYSLSDCDASCTAH